MSHLEQTPADTPPNQPEPPHSHDEHEHHDHDHSHGHDHDNHGYIHAYDTLWFKIASALHIPGYSHEHESIASDSAFFEHTLGIRTVKLSLLALGLTTVLQIVIYFASGSVALLSDTVHNFGDAANSIPLWFAFVLARRAPTKRYTYGFGRAEDIAGLFIVFSIGFSAVVILWESIQKLIHPQPLTNLPWIVAAGIVGFIGNELVALMEIRVGGQIGSAAMIADGQHARTDGLTSLAVVVAAAGAALGLPILDPVIGILMSILIIFITRNAAVAVWHRLMDAVDPALIQKIEKELQHHSEIKAVRRIQMRWVGHRLNADLALVVGGTLTIAQGDHLREHLQHDLSHAVPNLAEAKIIMLPYPETSS